MLDKLGNAVRKGFDKIAAATGVNRDSDLALYEKMTPEALNVIAETYGQDNLMKYIQTMEVKRMKAMQKGSK